MSTGVPTLPLGLDPLIAEAKERARKRRLLGLAALAIVVVATAAVTTLETRSSRAASGVCATAPPGWKEMSLPKTAVREATVVLTNWRFGPASYFYGLFLPPPWPRNAVIVLVSNDGPDAVPRLVPRLRPKLQVAAGEFTGLEGARFPAMQTAIRTGGRVIAAYVEVGALTPGTIAAANQALAGVQVCSG